jgi:hypothetical protein
MEGRRQSAPAAIKLLGRVSRISIRLKQSIFPECNAGALNVQSSRFCDHAILLLRSEFST